MVPDDTEGQPAEVASRMSRLPLSRQTVHTVLDLPATLIREALPGPPGAGSP